MATFYVGARPVLRGMNENDFIFAGKANRLAYGPGEFRTSRTQAKFGAVGTYSYYPLFGLGLLAGGPDNNHVPGEGYFPHDVFMSRRFLGLDTSMRKTSLFPSGLGARLEGFRFRPWEYKGLDEARATYRHGGLGHIERSWPDPGAFAYEWSEADWYHFHGIPASQTLKFNVGHAVRGVNETGEISGFGATSAAFSFGEFRPWEYKGTTTQPLVGSTETYPTGTDFASFDHAYGKNRVLEWRGIPASKAL